MWGEEGRGDCSGDRQWSGVCTSLASCGSVAVGVATAGAGAGVMVEGGREG